MKKVWSDGWENIPLDKFDENTWLDVEACRKTVGYQENPDWVCPGSLDQQCTEYTDWAAQYKDAHVGGFLCYPCCVKDAHLHAIRGWH
jgi:hypothetical protein